MAKQKSKKKNQIQHKHKVEKRDKIVAIQKDKPEPIELEEQAKIGVDPGDYKAYEANMKILKPEPFDPKAVIAKYLKKNGA